MRFHPSAGLAAIVITAQAACVDSAYLVREATVAQASGPALMQRQQVPPLWSQSANAQGADDVVFASDTTVIVSTVALLGAAQAKLPTPANFVAIDARTGATLWSVPRGDGDGRASSVVVTSPALWVRRPADARAESACKLEKLSLTSGKVEASVAANCEALAPTASGKALAIMTPKGLGALALDTGAMLWTSAILGSRVTRVADTFVVIDGAKLSGVDVATGKTLFAVRAAARVDRVIPTPSGDLLCVSDGDHSSGVALVSASGALKWQSPTKGKITSVETSKSSLVVASSAPDVLTSLSVADGSIRWQVPLAGAVEAIRTIDLPPVEQAQAAPLPRGKGNGRKQPPAPLTPPAAEPARTVVLVSVARSKDGDVLSMGDASDGHELSSIPLPDVQPPAFNPPRPKINDRFVDINQAPYLLRPTALMQVTATGQSGASHPFHGSYRFAALPIASDLMATEDGLQAVAQLHAAANSASLAASDLSRPIYVAPATQGQAQANMAASGAALTASTASMVLEAQAAAAQAGANAIASAKARKQFRVEAAGALFRKAVSQSLVVRPIGWTGGQGLSIVDTATGNWLELITGPPEHLFAMFLLGPHPFAVSPSGDLLVTLGTPLDPSRWTDPVAYPAFEGIGLDLMAFKLDKSSFHPAAEYGSRSMVGALDEVVDVY